MPRLPPSLFWRARWEISPMAAQLLPACRDLESAANELRWIREHVQDTKSPIPAGLRVWKLVEKRGRGIPLQYVLGTQPFGDLEIKCRPGVLIPRPETEAYTLHLTSMISQSSPPPTSLSIVDLCTGTGCIPLLLLHSLLSSLPIPIPISLHGVDISPHAIRLARANQTHNAPTLTRLPQASSAPYTLTFSQHDIFSDTLIPHLLKTQSQPQRHHPASRGEARGEEPDLLVSNPPYISPADFNLSTARAVRNHEPRLALVPSIANHNALSERYNCRPEDVFYARILEIATQLKPKRVLMEVGGWKQALRVVQLVLDHGNTKSGNGAGGDKEGDRLTYKVVEVWRDEPSAGDKGERVQVAGREVVVRGEGRGRAVYLSRI